MDELMMHIATANSRTARKWKNRRWTWAEFAAKCRQTEYTSETVAEYQRMSRDKASRVKDRGGFVAGHLVNGERRNGSVDWRSAVTLDIDYGGSDTIGKVAAALSGTAYLIYSTHSHTPEHPRYRLVVPLSEAVSAETYEPIARRVAERVGIEQFDHTTYQAARLMYWPSTPRNGEWVFREGEGAPLDPRAVLATYVSPMDCSEWPTSEREAEVIRERRAKAEDPTTKPGVVGAFCRVYDIAAAIEAFLPDTYEPTAQPGRYTYAKGHVAGGLVCVTDHLAYSHHETDPAGGRMRNAFDLVRVHKFGHLDKEEESDDTDVTRLRSYREMTQLATSDPQTRVQMHRDRQQSVREDFDGIDADEDQPDDEWTASLDRHPKTGEIKVTHANLATIMRHDRCFRHVRFELFSQRDVLDAACPELGGTHAWNAVDDSSLSRMCAYLSSTYGIDISVSRMVEMMLRPTAPDRAYNAVQRWIQRQKWDGTPRVDTLLTDYLGAEDTPLNRAIIRKWMAAAVARAFDTDPDTGEGIKFDYCPVLVGGQGSGKSTFVSMLAGPFRAPLSLAGDYKAQCEALRAGWINEASELAGFGRSEMEAVKDLISRTSDDFREAYGRTFNKNPRHSVIIASTNNDYFLRDITGNRRFWIVRVNGGEGPAVWAPRLRAVVPQLWAEAYEIYKGGELLMLTPELEAEAAAMTERHSETAGDPFLPYLAEWLDILLPADWDKREPAKRRDWYVYECHSGKEEKSDSGRKLNPTPKGVKLRDKIAIHEIMMECPYPGITKMGPHRIGAALRALGWLKQDGRSRLSGYKGNDGGHIKASFYYRPVAEIDEDDL